MSPDDALGEVAFRDPRHPFPRGLRITNAASCRFLTRSFSRPRDCFGKGDQMRLSDKIKQAGATGYILLWLLGIPIPILLIIFLLRGCT